MTLEDLGCQDKPVEISDVVRVALANSDIQVQRSILITSRQKDDNPKMSEHEARKTMHLA